METLHDIIEKITKEKINVDSCKWDNAYDILIDVLEACKRLTQKENINDIIDELDTINDDINYNNMNVRELSRAQLEELKRFYYVQKYNDIDMWKLASIDDYVSDDEIFDEYANTTFVKDDFFCTSGFVVE